MDTRANELCYTTRTGLRIGSQHHRQQTAGMTTNDIMWQGVLLGIEPHWTRKRLMGWIAYVTGIVFLFIAIKGMTND